MKRRFEQLVDRHGGRLVQLARYMLRSQADAEDVVQSSMVKLWEHLPRIEPGTELAWLLTCTRNSAIDRLRQSRLRRIAVEQAGYLALALADDQQCWQPEADTERDQRADRLHAAICELPEPGRSLIVLRDIQQLDVATVAQSLSLSENQVKVYTFRARRRLRQRLEEMGHEQAA